MTRLDCHLWVTTGPPTANHAALLDQAERQRSACCADPVARDRSVLAAALLRLAASHLTGMAPAAVRVDRACPDCSEPHGRPTLPGTGLFASVTRSSGLIAVALCATASVGMGSWAHLREIER